MSRQVAGKVWAYESESTKVTKPPKRDGYCESTIAHLRLVFDCYGILISQGTPAIVALSDAFEPGSFAYLRVLAGHRRRIKKEMSARQKGEIAKVRYCEGTRDVLEKKVLPFKLKYRDLKCVSCAGCKKTLLGESMEHYRTEGREQGKVGTQNFPQPVHTRTDWGPWCRKCVADKRVK